MTGKATNSRALTFGIIAAAIGVTGIWADLYFRTAAPPSYASAIALTEGHGYTVSREVLACRNADQLDDFSSFVKAGDKRSLAAYALSGNCTSIQPNEVVTLKEVSYSTVRVFKDGEPYYVWRAAADEHFLPMN